MEISQLESSDGVLEFAIAGDIIQAYVNPSVTSQFDEISGEPVFDRQVVLDVSDVTFLDSNGIGWFVALDNQFRKAGGKLMLHSPSPVLQRIFAMMKMTTVISVASTRDKAVTDAIANLAGDVRTIPAPESPAEHSSPDVDLTIDQVEAGETT